jgi:DNA-binding MarR family transcriptional regulator
MQQNEADQVLYQLFLFIHSVAHVLDYCGWMQFRIAKRENLEPIHLALLRRALRHKRVRFKPFHNETDLPMYAITRAAKRLHDRKLAKVHSDPADKRRRWLQITKSGADCIRRIDQIIAGEILKDAGFTSADSKRYYNLTVHLWNITRFFPPSKVTTREVYFPSDIPLTERIGQEQGNIQRFMADLQQDPVFSPSWPPWAEESDTD